MLYLPVFNELWNHCLESVKNGTFAKLTLAKTIGDTDLKNIYVQVCELNDSYGFRLTFKYKTEEVEQLHTVEETYDVLTPYLKNPFQTVLLFTTEFDLTLKINKKNVGTIIDQPPTFLKPSLSITDLQEKGIL